MHKVGYYQIINITQYTNMH